MVNRRRGSGPVCVTRVVVVDSQIKLAAVRSYVPELVLKVYKFLRDLVDMVSCLFNIN